MIGYLILYLSSRKYLDRESFQPQPHPASSASAYRTLTPPEMPYAKKPIHSLDEYELSAVYQNQGSKEATKEQLNQAMSLYPMDWSVQGQGSQYYQENEAKWRSKEAVEGFREDAPTEMMLPDSAQQEAEERKILQTYKPEKSADLLNYALEDSPAHRAGPTPGISSLEDVKTLVEKLYDKRGLIPDVVPSKQGNNVWEITEVREKNPKIIWEDSPTHRAGPTPGISSLEDDPSLQNAPERDRMIARREEVIDVPYMASDLAAGLDPFFQKGAPVREGRYNYNQWTPGLERMFAPTHPIKEWY
jgi:hypothetical protein